MLKKFLLCILSIFITTLCCYSYQESSLDELELTKYGKTYRSESLSSRLNRLENDFFGMSQSGDINSRINMLNQMASANATSIQIPNNNFYPGEKPSKIKNFWNNITSSFNDYGMMTGYTPPIASGYSSSMYTNGFNDFLNNSSSYCPYHNQYHFNNGYIPYNSFYRNNNLFYRPIKNKIINRINRNNYHNRYKNRGYKHFRPSPFRTYNPYGRNTIPTDINTYTQARSSVKIIRD